MMRRALLLAILALAGCSSVPQAVLHGPNGETVAVAVELAVTPEAQQRGLMERTELAEGHGMLFVFEQERPLGFWMKNTLIPLDILYFNAEGNFVSWAAMTPCTETFCPTYPSASPSQFALEVPAGFVATHGVGEQWRITFRNIEEPILALP